MAKTGDWAEAAIRYCFPVRPSSDGDTVELASEPTVIAENAVAYRSSLSFLNIQMALDRADAVI